MNDSLFDDVVSFEQGLMDENDVVTLFQRLIDDGDVWRLQGSYGRMARLLIEAGRCMLGPTGHHDYWGNYVPSRFEVQPGTPGSADFVQSAKDNA